MKIDKPLAEVKDCPSIRFRESEDKACTICGGKETYEIIFNEKYGWVLMNYARGTWILCKDCYKTCVFFDNITTRFLLIIYGIKKIFRRK